MTPLRVSPVHECKPLRTSPSTARHRFAFDLTCEPELYEVLGNVVHRLRWDGGVSAVSDLDGNAYAVICEDEATAEAHKDWFEEKFLDQLAEKIKAMQMQEIVINA